MPTAGRWQSYRRVYRIWKEGEDFPEEVAHEWALEYAQMDICKVENGGRSATRNNPVSGRKPLASRESAVNVVGRKLGCGEECQDEPLQETLLQRTSVAAGGPREHVEVWKILSCVFWQKGSGGGRRECRDDKIPLGSDRGAVGGSQGLSTRQSTDRRADGQTGRQAAPSLRSVALVIT